MCDGKRQDRTRAADARSAGAAGQGHRDDADAGDDDRARAEREGWITRDISEINQRILTASLTRKGEAALASGLAAATEIEEKIWTGVSAHTLEQLNLTLEHGIANLRDEIAFHHAAS